MTNEQIRKIFLENGFKEKQQPDGSVDLNPYVYDAARALLATIDYFATLRFYQYDNYIDKYEAHGKNRHYYISLDNPQNGYYVEIMNSGDWAKTCDKSFATLEQAQAWCQVDYDRYYKELNND